MTTPSPTIPSAAPSGLARGPGSRQRALGLGLLLTLVGLVLVAVLLPTAPGNLVEILPLAAVGLVLLWCGGILLGRGRRS
jgi:hypothetical protein